MVKINILGVATEGLRLIRREPRAVLVWSAALFLTVGLSAWLVTAQMAPSLLAFGPQGLADSSAAMDRLRLVVGVAPLAWLVGMVGYIVVAAAVLRAVIAPQDRRFFYLRFSQAEVWLVLSAVAGFFLFYIGSIVATVVAAVVVTVPLSVAGAIVGQFSPAVGALQVGIILGVVALQVAGFYVLMRFSMGPLMSFDERRFRLFESWRFTRGNGWRLLAVDLILAVGVLLVELAVIGVMLLSAGPDLAQDVSEPVFVQAMESLMNGALRLFASPWSVAVFALVSLVLGSALVIGIAPFGRAYQLLRDAPPDA
jgi:hypothetical protein